jgi:integrase
MAKLTDTSIKNAKPKERPYKLMDERGLFVLVNPNGSKLWRFRYKFNAKEKLLGLGSYPDTGLADARKAQAEMRKLLASGVDPSADRKEKGREEAQAQAATFEAVAREYLDMRVAGGKNTEAWRENNLRYLAFDVFSTNLAKRPISKIKAADVLDVLRSIERRGAYTISHRILALCSAIFRYGVATTRCERDVAADLKGSLIVKATVSRAAVPANELPDLFKSVDEGDATLHTKLAIKLLALTFVRTQELTGATWDEIDWDNEIWTIPASRTKKQRDHIVPLSAEALAILKALHGQRETGPYIIPGYKRGKAMSRNTMLYALYDIGYQGEMTGHGFRAIASTAFYESGQFRPEVIEIQLAHLDGNKTRAAYNRAAYLDERADLMNWWGTFLADHGLTLPDGQGGWRAAAAKSDDDCGDPAGPQYRPGGKVVALGSRGMRERRAA